MHYGSLSFRDRVIYVFDELYLNVYRSPLEVIALVMALAVLFWTLLRSIWHCRFRRVWRWCNRSLVVLSVALILVVSFWNRTPGTYPPALVPFASLIAARTQPEYYREMLMNILLYLPLGLSLGSSWADGMRIRQILGWTVLCGTALSLLVECIQGIFQLGTLETDDVIRNIMGTLLGVLHVPLAYLLCRLSKTITSHIKS